MYNKAALKATTSYVVARILAREPSNARRSGEGAPDVAPYGAAPADSFTASSLTARRSSLPVPRSGKFSTR